MIEQLVEYLKSSDSELRRLELEVRHIHSIYVSPVYLFAVAEFTDEEDLRRNWTTAAHQLTFRVQKNMPLEMDDLRWDMYLLLFVHQQRVPADLRKEIENNRFYFRKVVLSISDLDRLDDKLPIRLNIQPAKAAEAALFEEAHFLKQLQDVLPAQEREQLGASFFLSGVQNASEVVRLLQARQTEGRKEGK